jgi:hypothetical protein
MPVILVLLHQIPPVLARDILWPRAKISGPTTYGLIEAPGGNEAEKGLHLLSVGL